MKTREKLAEDVFGDLAHATTIGHLNHLKLDLHQFTVRDQRSRLRFTMSIPMKLPAFQDFGAQCFSITIPMDVPANRGESASVVEIAPLRYGYELFDSPYFAEEKGQGGVVHPMLRGDQVVRFSYPENVREFHEWIAQFCVTGS